MVNEIVLYDLPSRQGISWSLNPWKTRGALNFKDLPYKTEWVEYPDLAPKFKSYGIPPNSEGPYAYSSPAVRMSDGSYIMESRKIADALEKLQPEPSFHLKDSPVDRTQKAVLTTMPALAPIMMPRVPEMLLNPPSAEYFHRTRAERFGMPLPELAKSEKAGETAWKNAEAGIKELSEILSEHSDGPLVLGNTASYPDLILAGFWRFVELLDKGGDLFPRLMKADPAFEKHYLASKKWLEREDH